MAKLTKNDFGNPTFVAPQSRYVGEDLQAIQGASTALEQAYQKERTNFNKTDLALSNVNALDSDRELVDSELQAYKDEIAEIKNSGQYELMGTRIDGAAKGLASNKVVQRAQANFAQREATVDAINKNPLYRDQQERNAAIKLADDRYRASGINVDPETGNVSGDYVGYNVGKRADIRKTFDDAGKGWKADAVASGGIQLDPKTGQIIRDEYGNILTANGSRSEVDEASLKASLIKSFENDPIAKSSMQQDFELQNTGNKEYYTNGYLNDAGVAARDQYIDDQLEVHANEAAVKYGFVQVQSEIGLQQDRSMAAASKLKLDNEIFSYKDSTTVQFKPTYDPVNHTQAIRTSDRVVKELETLKSKADKSNDGSWTRDKARQLRKARVDRDNAEFKFKLATNTFKGTPEAIELEKEIADKLDVDPTSVEFLEMLDGNPDALIRKITNGAYDGSSAPDNETSLGAISGSYTGTGGYHYGQLQNGEASPDVLASAAKFAFEKYLKGVKTATEGKDISYDANVLRLVDGSGDNILQKPLTDQVTSNPAGFEIEDEKGMMIPLDQYIEQHDLQEGYEPQVNILTSLIGGKAGYSLTYKPKKEGQKDDATDRKPLNLIIYPGKAGADVARTTGETIMTKTARSMGLIGKDDRGTKHFTLDDNQIRGNTQMRDAYKRGQLMVAEDKFKDSFYKLNEMYEQQKYLDVGEHDITIPTPVGTRKATVIISLDEDGYPEIDVVSTKNRSQAFLRTKQSSLKDVYVELFKVSENSALMDAKQ